MVKKRFVELFNINQGGFNYLAFIGIVLGVLPGWFFRYLFLSFDQNYYSLLEYGDTPNVLKYLELEYFFNSLIYYVMLAFSIVGLSSFLKKDWHLIVFAGAVGFFYNIIDQLIINKYLTPPEIVSNQFKVDFYWLIIQTMWFMITPAVIVFLFRLTQRLDIALILGFAASDMVGAVISSVAFIFKVLIEFSEYYVNEQLHEIAQSISYNIRSIITTIFMGMLFYFGYLLHRKIKKLDSLKLFLSLPDRKNISRKFFYGNWLVFGFIIIGLLIAVLHLTWYSNKFTELQTWLLISLPLMFIIEIYISIVFYILIYRMWKYLPKDISSNISPAKAVGLLFIPFFNFYWTFVALHGFAKRYNRMIDLHNYTTPKLSTGWFLFLCIFHLFFFLFFIPTLIWPSILWQFLIYFAVLHLFIITVAISIICDSINYLPEA
ncbi:MAG: hypothetical protein AB1521_07460 [Bacteroidota bacterium]